MGDSKRRRFYWAIGIAVWAVALIVAFRIDRWVYWEITGEFVERTDIDTWRLERPRDRRLGYLFELANLLGTWGHAHFIWAVSVTMFVLAPKMRRAIPALVLCCVVSSVATQGIVRPTVAKLRPCALLGESEAVRLIDAQGPDAVIWHDGHAYNKGHALYRGFFGGYRKARGLGFPSGHATLSMTIFVALATFFPRGRRWFLAAACAVAMQRVLVGAHFLSGAIGGAGIGYACTVGVLSLKRVRAFAGY